MFRSSFYAICLLAFLSTSAALASPITVVSVSNANPLAGGLEVSSGEYLQASWSEVRSYTQVDISAVLFGTFVDGSYLPTSGTAYLTSTSLGAPLQQSFTFPDPTGSKATDVLLFSNLHLLPGTYYLTLASTSPYGGGWADSLESSGGVQTILDSGVTLGIPQGAEGANVNPSNPPARLFIPTNPSSDQLFFKVTAVPEPSSITLVGRTSIGLLIQLRLRKRA
jgi:hypothetical protein